jgi:hypothetical protein
MLAGGRTIHSSELIRRFGLEEAIRSGAADVKIRAWVTPDLASGDGTEMHLGYPSDAEAVLASPARPAWVAQAARNPHGRPRRPDRL